MNKFGRLLNIFRRETPGDSLVVRVSSAAEAAQSLIEQGHLADERGEPEEALRLYRAAIAKDPSSPDAQMNLGNALNAKGELAAAVQAYQRALAIDPAHAKSHYNLGIAQLGHADPASVEVHFASAVRLCEDFPQAWVGLALAREAQGNVDGAIEAYRDAIRVRPDFVEAHRNLGGVHLQLGRIDLAVQTFREALSIRADDSELMVNLAKALQEKGEIDEAIKQCSRALALVPDHAGAYGNLLFALNYHPDKSAQEINQVYRDYDAKFGGPHRSAWREHTNDRGTARRLRVGYVSPDFCMHPVRHFLEPLLAHHDRSAIQVHAYAELIHDDAVTQRYRGYVDHWIATAGMSDDALAERIRADRIDILIDLAGHTAHNRLGAFARKPAPVSVAWIGCGHTTGLSAIDHLLTDVASSPPGSEPLFAEKPWRLATPTYVYRPAEGMGDVNALPAMQRGYVTFGTLTRSVRINHRTIRAWAEILKRVEGSRLVVDSKNYQDEAMRAALTYRFAAHGIGAERLELGAHTPPWDVLRGIDIGLDCFPHNSGTTLFETLYMGLPYVTLAGRPSVGRLGSTILEGAGHPEWITNTEAEYIDKAVALASDVPRLAVLRQQLRADMQASPLMDEAGFARKVEAAYRSMFKRWAETPA